MTLVKHTITKHFSLFHLQIVKKLYSELPKNFKAYQIYKYTINYYSKQLQNKNIN